MLCTTVLLNLNNTVIGTNSIIKAEQGKVERLQSASDYDLGPDSHTRKVRTEQMPKDAESVKSLLSISDCTGCFEQTLGSAGN